MAETAPEGFVLVAPRGRFSSHIAELWEKVEPAGVVRGVRVAEHHLNNAQITHGGFLCSIMDLTFGAQVRHALGGRLGFTVRLVTDFLGPAKRGDWLEGRARLVRATATLAFLEGELTTGRRMVMRGQAVFRLQTAKRSPAVAGDQSRGI